VWWDGEERVVACLWIEGVFFEFVEEVYAVVLDAVPDIEGSKYSRLEDGVVIGETGFGSEVGEGCYCCWSCERQR
jgi:hypothetical protein